MSTLQLSRALHDLYMTLVFFFHFFSECPEEETRSLFEQLQANKETKEREYEEQFKMRKFYVICFWSGKLWFEVGVLLYFKDKGFSEFGVGGLVLEHVCRSVQS